MPQVNINMELSNPIIQSEVEKAMSSGKAPSAILVEVYKSGGQSFTEKLTEFFQTTWNEENIPQELKDTSIVFHCAPAITVSGQRLEAVTKFTDLGSIHHTL